MLNLIQALKQKDENRIISKDEVKDINKAERNKISKKNIIYLAHYIYMIFQSNIIRLNKYISLRKNHIGNFRIGLSFSKEKVLILIVYLVRFKNGQPPPLVYKELLEEDKVERDTTFIDDLISEISKHEDL